MRRAPPLRAFRATAYEAAGAVARIGRRSAAVDALLARHGVAQAGFITAWNPLSRRMPQGWNHRMQARLHQSARGRLLAEGWGRAKGWAEHHLLLEGDPRRLAALARRFRQWAIVTVAPRQPARLRWAVQPPRAG
ncbi:DUF3293 domain-containing protein [Falsiroseomonas sp.]|uniref:DUF3293 domain-containing protein n=1 Tax=Falsiroseomonas sp. TaxID=2870721 RepID=UPI002718DC7B|nr:DUF3293 domain-containing protein [Falsiroseomonas sp.]MDO9499905.1 DUF3293 domain-containing protein [Falsiroseomonas sp.]